MTSIRIVGCAFALLCLLGCGSTADHFLVYDVTDVPTEKWTVKLEGQFDEKPKEVTIVSITHWANVVGKQHKDSKGKVRDKHAHFTVYRFKQPEPEPRRTVRYDNQFGQGSIDVKMPLFLLVPAEKRSDPDSKPPTRLDHYKVYEVSKVNTAPPPPVVELKDQFGTLQQVAVGEPVFFCVPAVKHREGEKPTKLFNRKNHMVVYQLPALKQRGPVKFKDQFMDFELAVQRPLYLMVPTHKLDWVAHDN